MTYVPAVPLQIQFTLYCDVELGTLTELENIQWSIQESVKHYAAGLSTSQFTVVDAKVYPH